MIFHDNDNTMRLLYLALIFGTSFVTEIIMLNMSKDIQERTPQIISRILLSISLVCTSITFIIWGITPFPKKINYRKISMIMHYLSIGIKLICIIVFTVFCFIGTAEYIEYIKYIVLSFMIFTVSSVLPFVFEYKLTPQDFQEEVITPP